MMKWYYEWRLKRVRAEIAVLQAETSVRLADDYTAHSRLRVLTRLAEGLQRRLGKHVAVRGAATTTSATVAAPAQAAPAATAELAPAVAKEAA